MNWLVVLAVFVTDLTTALRDRRTWLAMVVVPLLLVPALLLLAPTTLEKQAQDIEKNVPRVAVWGGQYGPALMGFLKQTGQLQLLSVPEPLQALQRGDVDAVIEVPSGFDGTVAAGGKAIVTIRYDASRQRSLMAQSQVEQVLQDYSRQIVAERLAGLGIEPETLTPLDTRTFNVAPQEKVGASFLAMVMPLMLAVWGALGGMYAAIDAVAGEKERGTLEALLAAPPKRISIVTGKYLTVVFTSLVAAAVALLGMYVAFLIKPQAVTGAGAGDQLRFSIPLAHTGLILLVVLALSGFFSALELMLSAFARSFKEAQTYLSPLSIVVVLPALATQFVDPAKVSRLVYYVPLLNAIFSFKAILMGSINWADLAATLVSSAIYISLALRLTARLFFKESVIFRT